MPAPAGRDPWKSWFVAGEAQEEALARIDYLRDHGGGWCEVAGPRGIGKTSLLSELSRRALARGEPRAWLNLGPLPAFDWAALLAEAWNVNVSAATSPLDVRRLLHDHLTGLRAMNRPGWLFIDQVEDFSDELARGCRWLCQLTGRLDFSLTIVVARRIEAAPVAACEDADLRVELWPWEPHDCQRYVQACCQAVQQTVSFAADAHEALCECSAGLPKHVAKLVEWALIAAEAESETEIGAELIHAVAEELSPRTPRSSTYETSAAYGAW